LQDDYRAITQPVTHTEKSYAAQNIGPILP